MIRWAFSIFLFPRSIEHKGAPPAPNKLVKAVIKDMMGKHNPTPPKATTPIPSIFPI